MSPKMRSFVMLMFVVLALMFIFIQREKEAKEMKGSAVQQIKLPTPEKRGRMSVEEAILRRRSKRSYEDRSLTREQISQILWAAQGITDSSRGLRSAPSAGALYPMEIYAVCGDGLYRYLPHTHALEKLSGEDLRSALRDAALGQGPIAEAAMDIVITAVYERTTGKYGERGIRYVHIEAGHIAQNIHLQAVTLGLGSVPIGAFSDEGVSKALSLPQECKPLYIIPVGYAR